MASYKEQERQRREQVVLVEARRLLLQKGYRSLNMDELAQAVGISKPTLYQHFRSKESLVTEIIAHDFRMMGEKVQAFTKGTPLKKLENALRWIVRTLYGMKGIFVTIEPDVRKLMHSNEMLIARREKFIKYLGGLVDEAKAGGEISETVPTLMIVRSMFMYQMVLVDHHNPDTTVFSDEELEEAINQVVHLFLHGIKNNSGGQI